MSLAELSEQPGKVATIVAQSTYIPDPLHTYHHLCADKPNSMLLESAEIDSKNSLKSLIMVNAAVKLVCRGQQVTVKALYRKRCIGGELSTNQPVRTGTNDSKSPPSHYRKFAAHSQQYKPFIDEDTPV